MLFAVGVREGRVAGWLGGGLVNKIFGGFVLSGFGWFETPPV
jgi:hypothetical protein